MRSRSGIRARARPGLRRRAGARQRSRLTGAPGPSLSASRAPRRARAQASASSPRRLRATVGVERDHAAVVKLAARAGVFQRHGLAEIVNAQRNLPALLRRIPTDATRVAVHAGGRAQRAGGKSTRDRQLLQSLAPAHGADSTRPAPSVSPRIGVFPDQPQARTRR